tara:strand:+ start:230 stop:397 length:168 start_codon:yes stop_codon:yes gene_type:complete
MDPNEIELKNLSKQFAYQKIATDIDNCDDIEMLKNIAKSFVKLYYKQQETIAIIG